MDVDPVAVSLEGSAEVRSMDERYDMNIQGFRATAVA